VLLRRFASYHLQGTALAAAVKGRRRNNGDIAAQGVRLTVYREGLTIRLSGKLSRRPSTLAPIAMKAVGESAQFKPKMIVVWGAEDDGRIARSGSDTGYPQTH
jgi:hypothetical protein